VSDHLPLAPARGRLSMPPGTCAPSAEPAVAAPQPATAPTAQPATEPAVPATDPAVPATDPASGNAWDTSLRRWDLLYGLVFAAVFLVDSSSAAPDHRVLALTALAAMVPWYLLVGRPHVVAAGGNLTRRAVIFMVGLVVLFTVADLQASNTWFLCVALVPLCYYVLPDRPALISALTMNAVGAASVAYWAGTLAGAETATGLCIGVSAFTVLVGGTMGQIITQSVERAELIAQLETTRAELAEVSRQAGAMAERQRLAGEIHDTLAQGFSSILMLIQAAEAQLELSPPTARRQLGLAAHAPSSAVSPQPSSTRALWRTPSAGSPNGQEPNSACRPASPRTGPAAGSPLPPKWCCCARARRHWPTCASTPRRAMSRSGSATPAITSGWKSPTTGRDSTPR